MVTELCLENGKCFFTCLYRSPSQTQHELDKFCKYIDTLMDHINNDLPIFLISARDLNAKWSKWCNKDIPNSVGWDIDTLTSSAGYKQIMNKPTNIVNNLSSWIEVIFRNNLNLISNYGVDLSLFENVHHIIFGKISIQLPLPSSLLCEVWGYSIANVKYIQKALQNFGWEKTFENFSVDRKVDSLHETLLNTFRIEIVF